MLLADDEDIAEYEIRELKDAYGQTIRHGLKQAGRDVVEPRLTDSNAIEAIQSGDVDNITLKNAAVVIGLSTDDMRPPAVESELRERVILGMSNAVLDIDSLVRESGLNLSPKELQQRIEGRAPMTLGEYAQVRLAIARRLIEQS